MATVDQVIGRIRAFARARKWENAHAAALGFTELSRAAGGDEVSASAIRDFYRDGWSPTAGTLRRLEALVPAEFTGEHVEAA